MISCTHTHVRKVTHYHVTTMTAADMNHRAQGLQPLQLCKGMKETPLHTRLDIKLHNLLQLDRELFIFDGLIVLPSKAKPKSLV